MYYDLLGNGKPIPADLPAVWMQTMHSLLKKELDREKLVAMTQRGGK